MKVEDKLGSKRRVKVRVRVVRLREKRVLRKIKNKIEYE